jgi:hypothetical protein
MKLVAVVTPELTFDNMKKFQPHLCGNGKCGTMTTNRHYCSDLCRLDIRDKAYKAKRAALAKIEDAKPTRICVNKNCKTKLIKRKLKFCSRKCSESVGLVTRRKEAEVRKTKLKELRKNGTYQQSV